MTQNKSEEYFMFSADKHDKSVMKKYLKQYDVKGSFNVIRSQETGEIIDENNLTTGLRLKPTPKKQMHIYIPSSKQNWWWKNKINPAKILSQSKSKVQVKSPSQERAMGFRTKKLATLYRHNFMLHFVTDVEWLLNNKITQQIHHRMHLFNI